MTNEPNSPTENNADADVDELAKPAEVDPMTGTDEDDAPIDNPAG